MPTRTPLFTTAIAAVGLVLAVPTLVAAQSGDLRTTSLEMYLDLESVSNPQISPDGRQIVYTRGWVDKMNDRRESSIWIMNADGSRARFLVDGSGPLWSPDGTRIAFTAPGEPEGSQIYVRWMDAEGCDESGHAPGEGARRHPVVARRQLDLVHDERRGGAGVDGEPAWPPRGRRVDPGPEGRDARGLSAGPRRLCGRGVAPHLRRARGGRHGPAAHRRLLETTPPASGPPTARSWCSRRSAPRTPSSRGGSPRSTRSTSSPGRFGSSRAVGARTADRSRRPAGTSSRIGARTSTPTRTGTRVST